MADELVELIVRIARENRAGAVSASRASFEASCYRRNSLRTTVVFSARIFATVSTRQRV